ncbi:hypothetical protein [Xanthomonas arboricola]|uniref:hypothetical protein n=1 Tax=Xanthomonas arboricola TaxID=56448 RepID=UPI00161645AC|nr:hypothetical protein [Xanthomonas arboricola]MBB3759551.1 hypothetical protein [Xanthomonas arboricola]
MNPYFLDDTLPTPTPRVLLGHLASMETIGRRQLRLSFDAIPYRWALHSWRQYGDVEPEPEYVSRFFEEVPLFHLDVMVRGFIERELVEVVTDLAPPDRRAEGTIVGRWIGLRFRPTPAGDAISYSSITDAGTTGFLRLAHLPEPPLIEHLNRLRPEVTHVNADHWALRAVLDSIPRPHAMAVLDVGQASSNVMLGETGRPLLYFDVGRAIGANAWTTPATLKFCTCPNNKSRAPVLISHWHEDHYTATSLDPDLVKCTWIVPHTVNPAHMAFQNGILVAGSQVLQLPPVFADLKFGTSGSYTLTQCTGTGNNLNNRGNALMVDWRGLNWLLPGDASYKYISLVKDREFTAVVATHHGGFFAGNTVPTRAPGYARLVYSFGHNNVFGTAMHPLPASVAKHKTQWNHGNWIPALPPGLVSPGVAGDVRATAVHGVMLFPGIAPPTHSGAVAIGWQGPPALAGLAAPCPTCGKSFNIQQT